MGLDVYLRKIDNQKEVKEKETLYSKGEDELWNKSGKKYDSMTDAEKDVIRKQAEELALKLGLDSDGSSKNRKEIRKPYSKYKEHLFQIGYFRSSYNGGGFNNVMNNFIGKDLYYIFEPTNEYEFVPDWESARDRAKQVLAEFKKKVKEVGGYYEVDEISVSDRPDLANSKEKALQLFLAEKKKQGKMPFCCYTNYAGQFNFSQPIQVSALIRGKMQYADEKCVYVIEKADQNYKWLVQALEIVIATCNYVLTKKDPENYYLAWSS